MREHIRARLEEEAKKRGISINAEIVRRLEEEIRLRG
jgi:predicted HicB family RNase H-like nuclease